MEEGSKELRDRKAVGTSVCGRCFFTRIYHVKLCWCPKQLNVERVSKSKKLSMKRQEE